MWCRAFESTIWNQVYSMKYFLGIDGGGTKTAFLLSDETGKRIAWKEMTGCSYKELGIQAVSGLLESGTEYCLAEGGIGKDALTAAAIGLPCFGEFPESDNMISQILKEKFAGIPLYLTNDVEAGWAGSLGLRPGINVVAGTGSIAFGKNEAGISARSGGWSEFFGDEGSCYWLGRRTMELFSKEADGRKKKDALYWLVMEEFQLKEAMDFIDLMNRVYVKQRSKVASLQRLLLRAAQQGDKGAIALYHEAAEELGLLVKSIAGRLWNGEKTAVSYSGGLFHAGEFVLPVFEEIVEECNGVLQTPLFSPVQGAVLLAMTMDSEAYKMMKERYIDLKVILTDSGTNLTEIDKIKE